ncbi:2-oxo acid dehydrogenase subunit E2 [Antrihabitans spumae]|uniref:Dihydrolipoamide acetyltransferase component of pyruvate dehydrogenase complex n=1 Tax=Antrihabitans spumae TaxID=3373370 RepID=A0ABW7KDW1_9NOCA
MTASPTTTVSMPSLGENVTEGTVTRWLKQPGDTIDIDEPLLEVATDKVDTEIPSPIAGVLTEILAVEDDVIDIGAPLARVEPTDAAPVSVATPPSVSHQPTPPAQEAGDIVPAHSPAQPNSTSETAPSAASETGSYEQSAPETRPTPEPAATIAASTDSARPDVGSVPDTDTSSGGADRVEKLPRIRRTIAARMVESLRVAAQLTTVVEVDISSIAQLRRDNKEAFERRTGHKLSYLPFFVKAAIEALREIPVVNSSLDADVTTVTYHRACHLGMAVDSPKGLMVPVLREAQNLSITGLAEAIASAAERVRAGTIGADDLSGGTFTITNTGSRGALFDTPIINQPQSAILGTGTVVERLKPIYDASGNLTIAVAPSVHLSLSYDHRIVDGADAARYLGAVKQRLEQGYSASDLI